MSHDRDQQIMPPLPVQPVADGGRETGPAPANQLQREEAWKALESFAKSGAGTASSVVSLIQRAEYDSGVLGLLPEIAKRTTGSIALAAARAAGAPAVVALQLAFDVAKSDPDPKQVRDYLRSLSARDLATLDATPTVIDALAKMFPGPASDTLPQLHDVPQEIHAKHAILRWIIKTTNPVVLGYQLAMQGAADPLVASLDALRGWAWLDAFRLTPAANLGEGIVHMSQVSKDAAAKPKLSALAATYTQDFAKQQAEATAARAGLDSALDNGSDAALIETAARTQWISATGSPGDPSKVKARFAGKPPDVILEFVLATTHPLPSALELFDKANGDSRQHVRAMLRTRMVDEVVQLLVSDRSRRLIRKSLGRTATLLDLLTPEMRELTRPGVVKERALRQWIYEDGSPETLLWLAAGSGGELRESVRIVKAEKGNAWVKQLPASADEASLRRFAMHTKDAASAKFIREQLLREKPEQVVDPSQNEVVATDRTVYGAGSRGRLAIASMDVQEDAEHTVARLADLTDAERAELLKDPAGLAHLVDELYGATLVRAMYLLRPTVTQLLALPFPKGRKVRDLLPYLASRPDLEDVTAARNDKTLAHARALLDPVSPLDVFPSLKRPDVLAKTLVDNEALFEWILEETEPSAALALFAREPVRPIAAKMMGGRQELAENLPAHEQLLSEGQRGYDAIHKSIGEKTAKRDSQAYLDGELEVDDAVDRDARKLSAAAEKATLAEQIDELANRSGDAKAMLALVRRAPAKEQVKLLDGTHRPQATVVRTTTRMGPQIVFADLSVAQLLALETARDWIFMTEAPTVVLEMISGNKAAARAAMKYIEGHRDWLDACPRGGALMPHERAVFDELSTFTNDAAVLHALFQVRFDVVVENFDAVETKKLWAVARRLPPGQFDQQAVRTVVEKDIGPLGQWAAPDIELDDRQGAFAGNDQGFNEGQVLTLAQVKKIYGMTDQEVAIASEPTGWLKADQGKYVVKPVDIAQFSSTVLHEIGHSVDTMLGDQTQLIYELAGWKTYGLGQFEQWADDMRGFQGLSATEKPKVAEAWRNALHANTPVADMVDVDHPAVAGPQTAPLVQAAKKKHTFAYTERPKDVFADRVCTRQGLALYSLKTDAYLSAPSNYSLYAPAEYFAECYVEYYRGYDGTPTTEAAKGGHLAPWIKSWFTQHVDKIRLNPKRVQKPAS